MLALRGGQAWIVEAKPLFRPDMLRSHLSGWQMAGFDLAKLAHWSSEISSGRVDRFGEQKILPHFLADFFVGLLGYTGPAGQDRYTIGFERHGEVDGKYSDAVLGDFNGQHRLVVALEGKGPRDPLCAGSPRRASITQFIENQHNFPPHSPVHRCRGSFHFGRREIPPIGRQDSGVP
jgi:hypothetical protein